MKLQECIKSKKKDIIDLFCNIYGEYYRKHFSDRFDQITFLFPKLYFEDRDECYRELCNHQNNINPLPKIMHMINLKIVIIVGNLFRCYDEM